MLVCKHWSQRYNYPLLDLHIFDTVSAFVLLWQTTRIVTKTQWVNADNWICRFRFASLSMQPPTLVVQPRHIIVAQHCTMHLISIGTSLASMPDLPCLLPCSFPNIVAVLISALHPPAYCLARTKTTAAEALDLDDPLGVLSRPAS